MIKEKKSLETKILKNFKNIDGVTISSTHCGLKKKSKDDLVLIRFEKKCDIFSFLTKSKTPGEPIKWNKKIKRRGAVSLILINSGNANVFTGKKGEESINKIVSFLSKRLKVDKKEIYIASTGVIGELLDERKIIKSLPSLISDLNNNNQSWLKAANAIRTTDTFPKIISESYKKFEDRIIVNGIAKGSGMIEPNMATMLAFIFTNVKLSETFNKNILKKIVDQSFNSITVDGDQSTSDMVLFISNISNKNKSARILTTKSDEREFIEKIHRVMVNLAKDIVRDGEGAKKFIEIEVINAINNTQAKNVSKSIANSLLFKTAMAGNDFNWGRMVMAIGKSNSKVIAEKISLKFGDFVIIKEGKIMSFKEHLIKRYMEKNNINLKIDLNLGKGFSRVWTCDLTKEYISINADYRS